MAQSALTELEQQIEAVRREAFAAGYTAAMAAIRELAVRPAPPIGSAGVSSRRRSRSGASRQAGTGRRRAPRTAQPTQQKAVPTQKRQQRGSNALFVEEVLQSNAPQALRPAEIRAAVQREKDVTMSYASIRYALSQLAARHAARQVGGSNTWRHSTTAAPR